MRPNFATSLSRLAGAALMLAALAWAGPAWAASMTIDSNVVWEDGWTMDLDYLIIGNGHLTTNNNNGAVLLVRDNGRVTASGTNNFRGFGVWDNGQVNASGNNTFGDSLLLTDNGQVTVSGQADLGFFWMGGESNNGLASIGPRFTALKDSRITASSIYVVTNSYNADATYQAILTLGQGSALTTTGGSNDNNYYNNSSLFVRGFGSLIRIAGEGVTIDNASGAFFCDGATLEVGTNTLTLQGYLFFSDKSVYSLSSQGSNTGQTNVISGQAFIVDGAKVEIDGLPPKGHKILTAENGVILAVKYSNYLWDTDFLAGGFTNILYDFDYSDPKAVSIGGMKDKEAVLGGLGELGSGLTNNFAKAGDLIYNIVAGSSPASDDLRNRLALILQRIGNAIDDDPDQAETALRQLIGEGALHTVNAHHNTVSQVAATLGGRLQTILAGLPPSAGNGPAENRLWLKPFGQWNRQEDENDVLGYHYNSGGLMLGYDREMALPGLTLGLYGSLAQGRLENDLAKTNIRTAGLGLYSLYEFGAWFVDADLGYNRSDNDNTINPALGGQKNSEFSSDSFQAGLNFGRAFQVAKTASLTPSAGIRYTRVKQNGWQEKIVSDTDNTVIANWFGDSSENFLEIPLNLKLASTFETKGGATFSPELRLGGIIAANKPKSELRMGFVGSGDSTIISGIEPGRSRLVAGAGLKAQLSDTADIFLNYDLEARSGYQGHSASAGLGISF